MIITMQWNSSTTDGHASLFLFRLMVSFASTVMILVAFFSPAVIGWSSTMSDRTSSNSILKLSSPLSITNDRHCVLGRPTTLLTKARQQVAFMTEDDNEYDLEVQLLDDEDEEEIEYSPEEARAKQSDWIRQLERLARTSSRDASAVEKAQGILDDMFETYVQTEDSTFWPTVEVYNLILEAHAYSRSENGATEAEAILSRMEDPEVEFIARPNQETYLNVMDAWAMRKSPEKVESILKRQEERHQQQNKENPSSSSLQPTVESYNKMIKAYGIAGDIEKAESLFRSLLPDDDEENKKLEANNKSWVQIMKAYASQGGTSNINMVESLFHEMTETYLMGHEEYQPGTDAYNAFIRAIGKRRGGPQKAEAILFEMMERFRKGEEAVKPNVETFRSVLAAYSDQCDKKRQIGTTAAKIDQLLQIAEGFFAVHGEDKDRVLDERLYKMGLKIIGYCNDPKKATVAKRIVGRFQKSLDSGVGIPDRLYYFVLVASAYTDGSPMEKLEAFQIALEALKALRNSQEDGLDSSSAGMFVKACRRLMLEGRKRDDIVKEVFADFCRRGIVNEFVLDEIEKTASGALQLELFGGFVEDIRVKIRKEWARNVM
mmetsp:Transcript_10932/g.19617  ORF Transcript_10932/g.19617 Transcript_10932/m.19617 type:complete len:603 (-) Transcript_10932:2160-3968(-)